MNKTVVICSFVVMSVIIGLLLTRGNKFKFVPYYIAQSGDVYSKPMESVFVEPPTLDKIKQDLSGKTVVISGKNHQFVGPELNYMNMLAVNPTPDGCVAVDVKISADATLVNRKGLIGARKEYSHENVCGCLRVYYDKKDGEWCYKMLENIDLQKALVPNKVAPKKGDHQVYRYQN